jgi:hypothetical protein
VLQDLVHSYNNTIHPQHKHTRTYVFKLPTEAQVAIRHHMYPDTKPIEDQSQQEFKSQIVDFKFKLGDYVRVASKRVQFQKRSTNKKWKKTIYQIAQMLPTIPPTYKVQYINKENKSALSKRRYYKEELQLVPKPADPEPTQPKPPTPSPIKPTRQLRATKEISYNLKRNYKKK